MAWGKGKDRKRCAVLPDDGDSYRIAPRHAPQSRTPSAVSGVRWRSPRTWLWLLLVANLLLVLTFIILSARYFPESDSPRVFLHDPTPPTAHEPLVPSQSGASLRPELDSPRLGPEERQGETRIGDDQLGLGTTEKDTEFPSAVKAGGPGRAVESDKKGAGLLESAEFPVDAEGAYVEALDQGVKAGGGPYKGAEPVAESPEATEVQKLPPHVAGMLAHVKATQAVARSKQESAEATPDGEAAPRAAEDDDAKHGDSRSTSDGQGSSQAEMRQDLFVWLKADEGVQVVDRDACVQTQNPDACELTSWTNQIRSTNSLVPTAFQPASLLRPAWVPATSANASGLPAVAFSCPLKAKHASFPESVTLFFVLSPTHIEKGDSYAGQKFFGSSPYGQFALHGGKPAFFGSTGLVESREALERARTSVLVYRLQRQSVEIKASGRAWTPLPSEPRAIRLSQNAEISLGNAKPVCDTNAFRGRIFEVMLYSVALDDERVEAVEQYLRSRYENGASASKHAEHAEQEPDQPAEQDDESARERWHDAAAAGTSEAADQTLRTDHDIETEPSQSEPPARLEEVRDGPEPVNNYDPELVFEWAPSQALLDAKELPPDTAEQWANAVRERIDKIQTFQLGGNVLREFIHEQKQELLRLHDDLFGPSPHD